MNLTFQVLHDGSKELAQNDTEFSKYVLSSENKVSVQCLTGTYMAWAFNLHGFKLIASGCKKNLSSWLLVHDSEIKMGTDL